MLGDCSSVVSYESGLLLVGISALFIQSRSEFASKAIIVESLHSLIVSSILPPLSYMPLERLTQFPIGGVGSRNTFEICLVIFLRSRRLQQDSCQDCL